LELLDKIRECVLEEAKKSELKLVNIYFSQEKEGKFLNIELDKKGGISLIDISSFNEVISPKLDEINELDFPYVLNISSPGAERFISKEEINDYVGEYMEVTTNDKKVLGTLLSYEDGILKMKYFIKGRPKNEEIALDKVSKIQLRIKF
jgi:ribosome maturation factor RimP